MRAVLALVIGMCAVVTAQEPAFRASVEMVTVPVTATTSDGRRSVADLVLSDFRVFEDGVPQPVAVVSHERMPISLCVVLDRSNSMEPPHRAYAHAAIDAVFSGLMPDDEVSLVVFAEQPEVVVRWTPANRMARVDWAAIPPADNTSLLDALHAAMRQVEQARHRRSVILLVTDGGESTSKMSRRQVIATRQQSEALVYAFHVSPWVTRVISPPFESTPEAAALERSQNNLRPDGLSFLGTLIGDSGGSVQPLRVFEQARLLADGFLGELGQHYTIGYTPIRPLDGNYRRLKIETSRRGVKLRHRGGYLALPQPKN